MTRPYRSHAARHPTLEMLAELLLMAHGSPALDHAMRHLQDRCRACRRGCAKLRWLSREARHPDYTIVLAEARQAPALWRTLEALPYPRQLEAVEAPDGGFQTWGLCRLLQHKSGELACSDPGAACHLANLAVRMPRHLTPAYHVDSVHDLQALSFCYLGNAWRALGDLHSAGDAFDAARAFRLKGTADETVEAEALALEAMLLRDQLRLGEALALLDRVGAIHERGAAASDPDLDDPERAAAARLQQAWCLYHLGHLHAAYWLLDETVERLPVFGPGQARLALALRSGLVWCALALGATDVEARLAAAVQLAGRAGTAPDRLRLRRAEARLDLLLGERGPAEQALWQAAEEFESLDLRVDTALTYLDLAALYLREGACDALKDVVNRKMLPLFLSLGLGQQALRGLLLVERTSQRGSLTPNLLAAIGQMLEHSRRPSLAWWSAWATVLTMEAKDGVFRALAGYCERGESTPSIGDAGDPQGRVESS
jgi:hypothetical protein